MFKIKTLNKISPKIFDELDSKNYFVSDTAENFHGVLVRSANMHQFDLNGELLAIARAGAGYNNIPVDTCAEKGIVVFNTPGANANAVKELVLCGLLLSGRKVLEGANWAESLSGLSHQEFEDAVEKGKSQFVGNEVKGKKLGVIGLGAIGVMVANAAQKGLDMQVIGFDPYLSVDAAWNLNRFVTKAKSMEEIFSQCDYITLHLPLSENTKNLINQRVLSTMKDGAVLLNFARGGLVDEKAVVTALNEGKLRNYICDFPTDILQGVKGVIATPHIGASTPESEENCAQMAASELKEYLENGNIVNSVNMPRCEMSRSTDFRLCVIHKNVSNMVGQITSTVGSAGYNIEHMMNSSRGNLAYTILDLEQLPTQECVDSVSNISGVVRVRLLKK